MLRLFMDIFPSVMREIGDPFFSWSALFHPAVSTFEHLTYRTPLLVMYIVIITGRLLRQMCLLMQRHGWSDRSTVAFECHF
jgi:hypothetical protein